MSSQDTLQVAQAEQAKVEEFERQAQKALDTVQQQVDSFRQQAQAHRDEYARLTTKAQDEQRQEAEDMANQAREDQKKKDERIKTILG